MESYMSALELACADTALNKSANHTHSKLDEEIRWRQEVEQILMWGVRKTNAAVYLHKILSTILWITTLLDGFFHSSNAPKRIKRVSLVGFSIKSNDIFSIF